MDFMGIGPLELLLVLIIGFLILGPDKLPGMAAKAGQLYRNFKKATFDLTKTISEDVSSEKKTISEDLSSISKTITEDVLSESKAESDSVTASEAKSDQKSNARNSQKPTTLPDSDEDLDE
jgi:TatA/E family protein of Tat protein translocase